jgi:hypothetical protein
VVYEHLVKLLGVRGKPGGVSNIGQLARMEDCHSVTDTYLWLRCARLLIGRSINDIRYSNISVSICSMRFPECFTDAERVRQLQSDLGKAIGDSLANIGRRPRVEKLDQAEMQRLLA